MVSQPLQAEIRLFVNDRDLIRGLSVAERRMRSAEGEAERLEASVRGIGSGAAGVNRVSREMRELESETRDANNAVGALVSGLGALAGGFAIGGILSGATDRLREIRDIQRELGGADAQAAQRVIVGAEAAGLDPGNLAGAIFDATERAQEQLAGTVNLDLSGFGLDADTFARGLRDAGGEADRLRFLLDTLNNLPTDQRLAFLAEAAGGSAQAIALLANDAALADSVLTNMAGAATLSEQELAKLTDAQASMAMLKNEVGLLAGQFAGALAPALSGAVDALSPIIGFAGDLITRFPILAQLVGITLVAATAAASIGFATMGISALGATPAIFGMAAAIWAAVAPALPIIAALAAIGGAIFLLQRHVGGFANLWKSAWDGIVIAAVTAIEIILLPLRLLIETINAVGRGLSFVSGGAISVPQIANPLEGLGAERSRRLTSIGNRVESARRERAAGETSIVTNIDVQNTNGDFNELGIIVGDNVQRAIRRERGG